ncbi:Mitochondrial cruciform cutting endonuclease 1 [Zalerion maritima]|uniref:Mitochondrial cruciform cutting endonuclease 1 n=1 Tax=Zalerion maritima TaxID=339359 RepID=A0AAD5S0L8_9PEZI|nr:Mitochondrial cruciform cutting endonuclease 1 [Zalerion maritima]
MKYLAQLDSLTGVKMKGLCTALGLPSSGRKDFLHNQLSSTLSLPPDQQTLPPSPRILSIDMGLRNMAFSLLTLPKITTRSKTLPRRIHLQAWNRLSLIPPNVLPSSEDPYSPQNMSQTAYKLITSQFLPLRPTHILIERQRFRTRGQAAVQEWTVRVNMLESMLHAVLTSLRLEDRWPGGTLVSVNPKTVASFYACEDEKAVKGAKRAQEIKKMKIATVATWLKDGTKGLVLDSGEVLDMERRFLDKFDGKRLPRRKKSDPEPTVEELRMAEERLEKIDDLADSLLQGVIWLTWQENRRMALADGVHKLLESGVMNSMLIDRE